MDYFKDLDNVHAVAKATRKWADKNKHKNDFPDDLCGMCAIASAKLHDDLREKGITDAEIAYNEGHCFVLWKGLVFDVTATQFGKKQKVFVAPFEDVKEERWYKIERTFVTSTALRKHQVKEKWPLEQLRLND